MSAFEVFSNGVKTREVMRSDFIRNYSGIEAETSIGPFYMVTWSIDDSSSTNDSLVINTDEGKSLLFDLAKAEFISDNKEDNYPVFWIVAIIGAFIVLISVIILRILQKRKQDRCRG